MAGELVPLDQPYGERKRFVEDMQTAGQSTSASAPALPFSPAPQKSLSFDPLLEMAPAESPTMRQPTNRERLAEAAANSPNPLMREAARRIFG